MDESISEVIDELGLFVMYGTLREREIAQKAIQILKQLREERKEEKCMK